MTTTIDRPFPSNIEAERFILGSILLDNGVMPQASDRLVPEEFFQIAHRRIFAAMLTLAKAGRGIDPITLQEELRRVGDLDQVGGPAFIGMLFDGVPRFSNIENYVDIVKGKATTRRLIAAVNQIMSAAWDDTETASEQLESARRIIAQIDDPAMRGQWETIGDGAMRTLDEIETHLASDRPFEGIATGFPDLDWQLGGLPPELIVIGGRPGMGKTGFALGLLERASFWAANNNPLLLFFSLEMSARQVRRRMICGMANVALSDVRIKRIKNDDWRRMAAAASDLADRRILIDDTPGLTPNRLRAEIRKQADRYKELPGFVVIDYLQYMRGNRQSYKSRLEEITEISADVTAIKKEFGIPIVAIASLNRQSESRADNRPRLSDLRDSGQIESDAGIVLFTHRESYYRRHDGPREIEEAEIIIGKNRDGGLDTVKLSFARKLARFGDYDPSLIEHSWHSHEMQEDFA